jgi:hypothetical protein
MAEAMRGSAHRVAAVLLACAWLAAPAAAQDPRVNFLEQEVRNLQRQVQALTRQVEDLRRQMNRPPANSPRAAAPASSEDLPRWMDAGKWRGLKTGMSEFDVISALGPPSSVRDADGSRVLLYALEIGGTAFLGGSVTLRDRSVTDIHEPELK